MVAGCPGARPLAPQRTTAGLPPPALRGEAAGRPLFRPLCGALAARLLPLPSMAWRGGGGACFAHCPRRPPRGVGQGEPRPREVIGAAAGRWVAARDPFLLRRPASKGRSLLDGRPGCHVLTWPNERSRNWPGIVGRDMVAFSGYMYLGSQGCSSSVGAECGVDRSKFPSVL